MKTSSMGDLVHTLSALEEARHHLPSLSVDWVAEESFADVPMLSPAVARVIPVAMRRWRKNMLATSTRREIAAFVRALRSESYDGVIDAQGLVKSAWITGLARCPSRAKWGFDRASIREPLAGMVLHHRVHAPSQLHAIERLRILFGAALGYVPSMEPAVLASPVLMPATSQGASSSPIESARAHQRSVIFLHGTSRERKAWPVEHWMSLAQSIANRGARLVLPWGSLREQSVSDQIAQVAGDAAWVPPPLSIREIAAMMMSADAVVGVDSGLMHLSAALGRPTVAVMPAGLTQRFLASRFAPPWKKHVRVVVPPSEQSGIEVDAVKQSLLSLISSA